MHGIALVLVLAASSAGCHTSGSRSWREQLAERLPALGHRNFVVVADSAYPEQSAAAITTVDTGEGLPETLAVVLAEIDAAPHVGAKVWLDAELAAIPEELAPGIGAYRDALDRVLAGRSVERAPHLSIIEKLDETAKLFTVLVLKTDLVLPYTSVFVELDCGYWSGDQERRLRERRPE
jgi:hypothetical protein